MNRHYNVELYRQLALKIRELFPFAAIGADVLVGFPGEKEGDFKKTIDLIDSLPLTYVHAFPYSKRPFTQASGMTETSTKAKKSQRVKAIRALGEEKKLKFYSSQIGTTHECLVEKRDKGTGLMKGTTSNYIPVHILESGEMEHIKNQMVTVEISDVNKNKVFGLIKL
jgi:threonylcarbamoyladenosine tRNA methylthiotransferase MtaB